MVAEGGDINAISFSNLKDILSFLSLDFFTIKFERDHISCSFFELSPNISGNFFDRINWIYMIFLFILTILSKKWDSLYY